jgi:DNA-directed RNA polymerase specialized sigma24 family protein
VAEYRYLAGMTLAETAAALNISEASVTRDWTLAKAWLFRELNTAPRM